MTDMLKVNLHITQKCNYACRYCFAHFNHCGDLPVADWKRILDNLKQSGLVDKINFAGGEPMLYRGFSQLVDYAHDLGFTLSVITNGSLLLNPALVPQGFFRKLDMLGISVDSVDPEILRQLGCCDHSGKVLTEAQLIRIIRKAKAENPRLTIKLNTVVTKLNQKEQLTRMEAELPVDRWKFLKMKLFDNGEFCNRNLVISETAFQDFLKRNRRKAGESVPEESLTRSYIIIDNQGRLLDNENEAPVPVGSLLKEPFQDIFARYHFDADLYWNRYQKSA